MCRTPARCGAWPNSANAFRGRGFGRLLWAPRREGGESAWVPPERGERSLRITALIRCKTGVENLLGGLLLGTQLQRGDGNGSASERIFLPFSPPSVQAQAGKTVGERGDCKCSGSGMYTLPLTSLSVI